MAEIGQPEGVVVQAAEQTGGHGRHGREWVSPIGNLYLSLLLRPSCQAMQLGQLSLVTGLAVFDAAARVIDDPALLQLKWPNDVILDGKKCAGLLLESDINASGGVRSCVVGVGVNLVSAPEDIGHALSAYCEKAMPSVDAFRDIFLDTFKARYKDWVVHGFDSLREDWLSKAHPEGTPIKIKIGPQLEQGHFYDIDENGNARIRDQAHRVKTITAGDVFI